jgi:hyperosmotically inducible periplasmic protein
MNTKFMLSCLLAVSLFGPAVTLADADSAHPVTYVKDSAITADIKTKLAAHHISSLTKIKVDTDASGVVWLSGTAPTQEAADQAEQLARSSDGVRDVQNKIVVAVR